MSRTFYPASEKLICHLIHVNVLLFSEELLSYLWQIGITLGQYLKPNYSEYLNALETK